MKEKLPVRQIRSYGEAFKRKVIEEYLSTGCTKAFLIKKYHIYQKDGIQTWMRQMGYTDIGKAKCNFTVSKAFLLKQDDKEDKPAEENPEGLSKRIKELEQRLEEEQLLREMYEKMIKAAEEQFKIDIRKKRNTR